jgi:AcrR family transcriptional regulator
MADEEGLDALSMRRLGRAVGVEAMSIYHHVNGKEALLEAILEQIIAQIKLPQGDDWKAVLRERTLRARKALLPHPWAAALLESTLISSGEKLRQGDSVLGVLSRGGFPLKLAYRAVMTIDSYLYGFLTQEIHWPASRKQIAAARTTLEARIGMRSYPHLSEMITWYLADDEARPRATRHPWSAYQEEFEFGLDLVLNGLDQALRQETHQSDWAPQ